MCNRDLDKLNNRLCVYSASTGPLCKELFFGFISTDHLKDQFILWTVNWLYFDGKNNKRICPGLVLKMNEVNTALTYHAVATAAKQRDMMDSLDQCCLVKAM